jgi:hypothetical protein
MTIIGFLLRAVTEDGPVSLLLIYPPIPVRTPPAGLREIYVSGWETMAFGMWAIRTVLVPWINLNAERLKTAGKQYVFYTPRLLPPRGVFLFPAAYVQI